MVTWNRLPAISRIRRLCITFSIPGCCSSLNHQASCFIFCAALTSLVLQLPIVFFAEIQTGQTAAGSYPTQSHSFRAKVVLKQPVITSRLFEKHRPDSCEMDHANRQVLLDARLIGSFAHASQRVPPSDKARPLPASLPISGTHSSYPSPADAPKRCRLHMRDASDEWGRNAASIPSSRTPNLSAFRPRRSFHTRPCRR